MSGTIVPGTNFSSVVFDTEAANIGIASFSNVSKKEFSGIINTNIGGTLTVQAARASSNTTLDFNVFSGSFLIARSLN